MALCLEKKIFDCSVPVDEALAGIAVFLHDVWQEGCMVEVNIYASGRLKKRTAHEELRKAIKEYPCDWEHGEYNFLFSPKVCLRRFFWKGRAVHITASEGLFLFRRLVLGEPSDRYALHNIRKRLGRDFLSDASFVKDLPPCHNVDCALLDNHERNAGKSLFKLAEERLRLGIL
jgi:hypothetical protein